MNRVLVAAGMSALLLSGCSILPEAEPVDVYRLSAPAVDGGPTQRVFGAPTVMVSLPSASRTVGGDNIMVGRPDGSMAAVAGVRWAASARNLMQDYIVETFEAAAPTLAPLRPGDGISGDFDLAIDLRQFQAEYDQGPEAAPLVHVSAGARLISAARELEGSTVLSSDVRASGNTMREIIAAFETATASVASELAAWTVERVEAAEDRIARLAQEPPARTATEAEINIDRD